MRGAEGARRHRIVLIAQNPDLGLDDPSHVHPGGRRDQQHHRQQARLDQRRQRQQQEDRWEAQDRIDEAHQQRTDGTAMIAGDHADAGADGDSDRHGGEANAERDAPAHHQAGQHVAPELVGTEQMRARQGRRETLYHVDIGLVEGQQEWAEKAGQRQDEDDGGAGHGEPVLSEAAPGTLAGGDFDVDRQLERIGAHRQPSLMRGSATA
jgi:hypothetical protein